MYTFLKRLNVQTEIHFICRNIFSDAGQICRLNRIKKYEKGQNFIIGFPLRRR